MYDGIQEGWIGGIVSGTEQAPVRDADPKKLEHNAGSQDKTLATVVLSVYLSLLYLIGEPVEPVAVWKKLEEQF